VYQREIHCDWRRKSKESPAQALESQMIALGKEEQIQLLRKAAHEGKGGRRMVADAGST
jgi:hypothetical protein